MMMHRAPTRPRVDSSTSDSTHLTINGIPPAPPPPPPPALPTPPALEAPTAPRLPGSTPPTPSTAAALLNDNRPLRPKRNRKPTPTSEKGSGRLRGPRRGSHDAPTRLGLPVSNMLEGIVPPINILIVEDNSITRRVLEGLMKRLRVRWDTAINGQIAVDKWRKGGYHLILMDIQMPVMNGLQATKEIRRLEKVNGIGVFSSSTPSSPDERRGGQKDPNTDGVELDGESSTTETTKRDPAVDKIVITESIFKSPIIIVALTASALQSDRHEALAAGCNDFLTKPVHLPWLERKVKEWGCMQALIDFDGWKRWRDINEKEEANKSNEQKAKEREQDEKHNKGMERLEQLQEQKAGDDKRKAANRASIDGSAAVNGFAHSNGGH